MSLISIRRFCPSRKRVALAVAVCLLLAWPVLPLAKKYVENKTFESFTEELFRLEVCTSTITLHYTLADPDSCQISDYPITFGSLPESFENADLSSLYSHADTLSSFDSASLFAQNALTLAILKESSQAQLACPAALYLQEPLSPSLGIQAQLPVLLAEYTFRCRQDVLDYLQLLQQLPQYFENILAFETEKARCGLFMNQKATDGVIEQCRSFIQNPDENYLIPVFEEKISTPGLLSDDEQAACLKLHQKLIKKAVIPAYSLLIDGLSSLKESGKNPYGLCYAPDGRSYYLYLLQTQVGTTDSPKEIEQRLYQQLQNDAAEVQTLLAEDPSLLTPKEDTASKTPDPSAILEQLKSCITQDFPALTDASYEVKYVHEDLQEFLSPAFYLTPPVDTNSPNAIYINPHEEMSATELFTTLAHEGFPGHLYQTLFFAQTNPPLIRHLYGPAGYIEGWATYIESYAYSYAEGEKNQNRLQWLNRSMNLDLYCLMDLGIHYYGWTPSQSAAFLEQFHITDQETISSIYQYILETPANYLKYYYGYLNFLDLKDACESAAGEDFDLKSFHHLVLKLGPMPFSILKENVLP